MKPFPGLTGVACVALLLAMPNAHAETRGNVEERLAGYSEKFYRRHNEAFRVGAAIHYAHGKAHDVLQLKPFSDHERVDLATNRDFTEFTQKLKARTEPTMEYYAPYTARMAWKVFRAIDWTHGLHEMTYDVMSDKSIPWQDKQRMLDVVTQYYLTQDPIARSPAPLDVTMRRAAVMMKPYFTLFRNYYPRTNNYFYAAHWWHPVIYEAQMLGGNGAGQDVMVKQTDATFFTQVLPEGNRPLRMLLSRENMPRYSRLSPESANAFDNLHMFHGIVYDIMSYEGWTPAQKKAELYRVIQAMSYQPGDEKLARKFSEPYPDLDPRIYYDWQKTPEGSMSKIMMEMMMEMMPHMMPSMMPAGMGMDDMDKMSMEEMMAKMTPEQRKSHDMMMEQFKKKLTPGIQEGELPGSLHDAMMAQMKQMGMEMKMMPGAMEPGKTPSMMVEMMLKGWQAKHGSMPDIAPYDLSTEPSTVPPVVVAQVTGREVAR